MFENELEVAIQNKEKITKNSNQLPQFYERSQYP
jgi:hypothetical protein